MKVIMAAAAAAATLAISTMSQAEVLRYTISGIDTLASGQVEYARFDIDTAWQPDDYAAGIGFYFALVPGTFTYGSTTTTDPQDITFYLDAANGYDQPGNAGGLFVGEGDLLGFYGPQLFEGPIESPRLKTGQFTLYDEFSGSPIALTVAVVPEPATWALMILGFGAIGGTMRRRPSAAAKLGVA